MKRRKAESTNGKERERNEVRKGREKKEVRKGREK